MLRIAQNTAAAAATAAVAVAAAHTCFVLLNGEKLLSLIFA